VLYIKHLLEKPNSEVESSRQAVGAQILPLVVSIHPPYSNGWNTTTFVIAKIGQ